MGLTCYSQVMIVTLLGFDTVLCDKSSIIFN